MQGLKSLFHAESKNKEWYKEIVHYLVPFTSLLSDKAEKLRTLYGIVNNDVASLEKWIKEIDNPYAIMLLDDPITEEPTIMYNRIFPKFSYHVSEFVKRAINYQVSTVSEAANEFKKEELEALIRQEIEKIIFEMQTTGNVDEQKLEEIASLDFKSSLEEFFNGVLEYFLYKFNIKELLSLSAHHVLVADSTFIGIESDEEPKPKVYNNLRVGYHKSPDELDVEDSVYFYYSEPVDILTAYGEINKFGDEEDKENFQKKYFAHEKLGYNVSYDRIRHNFYADQGILDMEIGNSVSSNTLISYKNETIWRTYIQFLAYDKIKILSFINEYNKLEKVVLDDDFKIPSKAVKKGNTYSWVEGNTPYQVKIEEHLRRYEAVRYAQDFIIKYGPCKYQGLISNKLSVKGRQFVAVNTPSVSLVERALPSLLQYIIVKKKQNKEIGKYNGVVQQIDAGQIPDYLGKDENGKPIIEGADKLAISEFYTNKLGKFFYDNNAQSMGLPSQYTRTDPIKIIQNQSFAEIINMQNFLELLDREIGIQMLVPPQAEGIFSPYSSQKNNEYAVQTGYVLAERYYTTFSEIWKRVIEEYINQFRYYYMDYFKNNPEKTEVNLNYVFKNVSKVLKITPEILRFSDVGLFIQDSSTTEEYRQLMLNFAMQPIAQNAGEGALLISTILKSIANNDSPEKIHKLLVVADKEQQRRIQQQQEAQFQQQQALAAQKNAQVQQSPKEIDQDGVTNVLEDEMMIKSSQQKDRELAIKEAELNLKEKQLNKEKIKKGK